jgi:hypothetical protein
MKASAVCLFDAKTLSRTTLNIQTLRILSITLRNCDIEPNVFNTKYLNPVCHMLYTECHCSEWYYAECHCTDCHNADRNYAECHYAYYHYAYCH